MLSYNIPLVDGFDMPKFGLASFRRDNEDETRAIVNKFLSLTSNQPVKHIEISELYGNGHVILSALASSGLRRSELYLTFKVWPKDRLGHEIISSCLDGLALVNEQYFDLCLIHAPVDPKHRFEQWTALETLKEQGYVRSIGICKYSENQVTELMKNCTTQPAVCETEVTVFGQSTSMTEYCSDSSIVLLCCNLQAKKVKHNNTTFNQTASSLGISQLDLHIQWATSKGFAVMLSPEDFIDMESIYFEPLFSSSDKSLLEPLDFLDEGLKTSSEFVLMEKNDEDN